MKTEKMSFKNIKDVLSRSEMKMIMAGSAAIGCTMYLASGTQAFSYSGGCSESTIYNCMIAASNLCGSYISAGYSGCSYQCG